MHNVVLELFNVSKYFFSQNIKKTIINDTSLKILEGEVVSFVGRSGLGKTTVLQICGLLDNVSSGEVAICGQYCKNENFATKMRRKNIGFVYQFHHLLSEFNVIENIMFPLILNGYSRNDAKNKSMDLLKKMSLDNLSNAKIFQLSGGEKQRITIARSIIHEPKIVIADEPTGNLDPENAERIFSLLIEFVKINKAALLVATHNILLAKKTDYIITINDQKIVKTFL